MKKVFFLVSFILVSCFFINHAYALKSYNASKSNTAATEILSDDFEDRVTELLAEAEEEAIEMAKEMLKKEQAQAKSRDGQFRFTVKIVIRIEPE